MPFRIEKSTEVIGGRAGFADFCNRLNLREAVEVGVDRGDFAFQFLQEWKGFTLLLIDPYEPYENMPWPRDADRLMAIVRLAGFGERVRFIPIASPQAVKAIHADWHIQFVYIDGAHAYEAVKADVEAWWDRLDPGGVLAGHDYVEGGGVVKAVMEFAHARGLTIYTVEDGGDPMSWYIKKPL